MGKSSQTTTQQATQNPFEPAQAGIESIIGQAETNLNRERALAPTDPRTLQSADILTQLAEQNLLGGVSQGGTAFAENVFNQAPTGTNVLQQFAQGDFGLRQDPQFQQNIENQQTRTADLIRRLSAGAGRGGSPAETGILARELGQIGQQQAFAQTNVDLQRQLGAAQTLGQQGAGLIGGIAGLQQSQLFAPGLLQQAGAIGQGAQQTELDNILAIIQQQQGVLFPAGGLGGQQTGTSTQVNQANPVTQAINLVGATSGFFGGSSKTKPIAT